MSSNKPKKSRWDDEGSHQQQRHVSGEKKLKEKDDIKSSQVKYKLNNDAAIVPAGTKRLLDDKKEEKPAGFSIKIKSKVKPASDTLVKKKNEVVASVFNDDSESEEEEMPLECKMKMRNIGRDTITSSGPKSFNKGKDGFVKYSQFQLSMKPRNNMEKQNDLA